MDRQAISNQKFAARTPSGGLMARNRFEKVDDIQPDAINLTLSKKGDLEVGVMHVPKTAAERGLPADLTSEEVPAEKALVAAIQYANARKIPIVVIDNDNIWRTEWGDLWRYEEDE
jgi:hypothetical protein